MRVRVLGNDHLEIRKMIIKNTQTLSDDEFGYVAIGIPVDIYISNLSKKHLVIWRIECEVIDYYKSTISLNKNVKLLKNLEYDKNEKIYINELHDDIKIGQENTNHFYGIIEIGYFKDDAKDLLKIINKLKNKVTLDGIVGLFSDEPIKLGVKINKIINEWILNKEIIISISSIDGVKRIVPIKNIYQICGDLILMVSYGRYFTDNGIENINPINRFGFNKIIEKMNEDKIRNYNYDFIH